MAMWDEDNRNGLMTVFLNKPKYVIRHGLHGFTLFLCRKSVLIRVIRASNNSNDRFPL